MAYTIKDFSKSPFDRMLEPKGDGQRTVLFIPAVGPVRKASINYRTKTGVTLSDINLLIDGSFDAINIGGCYIYANEYGRLEPFPVNFRASRIWMSYLDKNDLKAYGGAILTGDVIITGPSDAHGYSRSLTDSGIQTLVDMCNTSKLSQVPDDPSLKAVLSGYENNYNQLMWKSISLMAA